MTRIPVIFLAAFLAAAPLADASAQDRGRRGDNPLGGAMASQLRQDRAREETRDGQRMALGDIVRRVSDGRPGRMLGVQPRGGDYVVRWEYPGGRVADITVDGRTGRVTGER